MKISKIIIYDEPTVPQIQLDKLQEFLTNTFQTKIKIKENFFENLNQKIFEEIACTRIFDLKKPFQKYNPSIKNIQIEKENQDTTKWEEKILYDGFELQKIIKESIPKEENKIDTLHIILTNKLTCTFDENDFRYHARALISSNPTIISTSGIIEAPAKPKQYYLELMTDFSKERINEIKEKYKGEFLDYHDSRMSQIMEGYLLQTIMYYETGDIFCEKKDCRLFNAHWQKDLLNSQLKKKLCTKHSKIIKKMIN